MRPPRPWLALSLALVACSEAPDLAPSSDPDPLAPLRAFEAERRAATDFARLPASDAAMGADPIGLRRVPGTGYLVSALRGRDAVVLLDEKLHELARAPAPASPTGIAFTAAGEIVVSGEASPDLFRYAIRDGKIVPAGRLTLAGLRGVRDLAWGPEGRLYALDERAGALITLEISPAFEVARRTDDPVCAGPFRVDRQPEHVLVDCLFDHTIVIRRVAPTGLPIVEGEVRIRHDGPIWSFAAQEFGGALILAAGGVEDHPLDRTGGSFGYIDSFVTLYRVAQGAAERLRAINVSEHGVITPKAIELEVSDAGSSVIVTGYGAPRRAEIRWPSADLAAPPAITTRSFPPGATSITSLADKVHAHADPLLDAWLVDHDGAVEVVKVSDPDGPPRTADVRLGEALFFTNVMAPWNKTEGPLSRFTCETCHFEGYVDGRTHHTGRGDVHATTKPLLGLFNNRPHFSRALDPDLATMVNAEFRVAGAKSDHDPWFALKPEDAPWLTDLDPAPADLSPESLRRSLMAFLMAFTHRPNPAVQGRAGFTPEERAGAGLFRDHCARCHAPRLIADTPASAIPFDRWEPSIFSREGPIVWASTEYQKTGVTPYVHENGARTPSLRRLYKKRPYLTNGSAPALRDVLERARFSDEVFLHASDAKAGAGLRALGAGEVDALLAFLDLL